MNLEKLSLITEFVKEYYNVIIIIFVYSKILNIHSKKNIILLDTFILLLISMSTIYIKNKIGNDFSIIYSIFMLSIVTSRIYIKDLVRSTLLIIISYSIHYIMLFIGILISFVLNMVFPIQFDLFNLLIIFIVELLLIIILCKIKRIKYGFEYLKKSSKNGYLELIVLNISIIIVFCRAIFINGAQNIFLSEKMSAVFVIFSIVMFFTIKKSIEVYYKQKMLIKDLDETKNELEEKKKEVEELEKENLGFNKRSHSLAYKQKSLEFKLNKLLMKSEFAEELGLTDEFKKISKQMKENEKLPKLDTTGILEVDDMLNMMQEECRLNEIDFSLQIKGNIYQMTNNYIDKNDLATLLADHIKDAIIAINHTDNLNKSIMVRLGKIDDCFSVYFYDSGVEFPEEIFNELGTGPITAYANEGGTGLGFMNTFDVLRKKNASLIVENLGKPSIDNYTKIIKIIFDNKNKIMFDKTKIL